MLDTKNLSPLAPMRHQILARRAVEDRPRRPIEDDVFALLMEMGTGKSKVVCDEWADRVLGDELRSLLIIAPAGSYENWWRGSELDPSELEKQLPPSLLERCAVAGWRSGSRSARREVDALVRETRRPRVLVCNVEALSTVREARLACWYFLGTERNRNMIVADESTTIRGHDSERTRVAVKLGTRARVRRIMTGLVTPQSPLNLFSQYLFLDWRILGYDADRYWPFKMRYAIMKPSVISVWDARKQERVSRRIKTVVGYRNEEELRRKIAPYSFRVLRKDCLDLPGKVYQLRHYELTKKQREVYSDLREFATAQLSETTYVTATMAITLMMRLQEVACGFVTDEQGQIHDLPTNSHDEMIELLREHGDKAVIWTYRIHHVDRIVQVLEREFGAGCAVKFYGPNKSTRKEDELRWKRPEGPPFMVATTAAGGRGNNWTAAWLNVYAGNDYDLEHRMQSEDRTDRFGQKFPVNNVDLVARGTVMEKILKALRRKLDMSAVINGDNWREWVV